MTIDLVHIILFLSSILFGGIGIVLLFYLKRVVPLAYMASEESAEIFTRLQSYREHLSSLYEKPMFYGDETLQTLLDHTQELTLFLERYEPIYSFTQPDLIEQLQVVNNGEKEENL